MNFEEELHQRVSNKLEQARNSPIHPEEESERELDYDVVSRFISGESNYDEVRKVMEKDYELSGTVYFDTLTEFSVAIRQLVSDVDKQNEILDHENAHALELEQRGYSFKYGIDFIKNEKNIFVFKLKRTKIIPYTTMKNVSKRGVIPDEREFRDDIIAIVTAPERLTNGKLSAGDKRIINGN